MHLENKSISSFSEDGLLVDDFSMFVTADFCSILASIEGDDGVVLFEDVDVLVLTCLPLGTITVARPVIFSLWLTIDVDLALLCESTDLLQIYE